MSSEYADVFKEETYEILEDLEKSLLELEANPDDADIIAKVFRAIHTIKGSGAMFGFDMLSNFAHEVENAYELVREGNIKADKKLIDITLQARDFIKIALENENLDNQATAQKEKIISDLTKFISASTGEAGPEPEEPPAPVKIEEPDEPGIETTYRIRFHPAADILEKGTELIKLLKELHDLGTCHAVAHISDLPPLEGMEPNLCYVNWDIVLTTTHSKNAVRDVFIFVEDNSDITIDLIDTGDAREPVEYKKVGNILVEKGDLSEEKINEVVKNQKKMGEILVEEGIVNPEEIESALVEQQHVREVRKKRHETETASSLRVSSEKVDLLVNLVGELVTLQARLSQLSHKKNDSELITLSEEVERITWDLRDSSMEMRMLPIGSTFSRFKRLVRDLSHNLEKEVELTTEGGDTELDKTVIEKLNDPLVHIIRNCIDHGIELPGVRQAAGKNRNGSIHLSAFHSGANVVIQVTDDGGGLDTAQIKKKAVERGIITAEQYLPPEEIFSLIFEPGFSTAKSVTGVSGRGVGMDVVKRNIETLRGAIDIDSQKGFGTTITLNIPLTLAIIDGLLVEIDEGHFVFPLSMVESCIEIPHVQIAESNGQNYVNVRGEIVPYIYLRDQFQMNEDCPSIEQIVIVEMEKKRVGFVVDHVIGGHQTVIKSLGKVYKHVEGISGATILGDGTIALILDVPKLVLNAGPARKRFQNRGAESY